jgi:hypothetical protein
VAKSPFDFFRALQEKTRRPPDRAFDEAFWRRFDAEFGKRGTLGWPEWLRWGAPAGVGFALVLGLVWALSLHPRPGEKTARDFFSQPRVASDIVTYQPVLENLEMFEGGDGDEDIDFTHLSEKEWKILLDGKDG